MKNYLLVFVIVFLVISNQTFSQSLSVGIIDGTFKSTIKCKSISYIAVSNIGRVRNTGIFLNFSFNKNISIQTELYKKNNGAVIRTVGIDGGGLSGNYDMTYCTIPVLGDLEFGKTIKFHCYTGLYFDFLNSAKNKTTVHTDFSPVPYQIDASYDPTNEFRKFGNGCMFGLGIKFPLTKKVGVFIDSRYTTSFTKSVKDNIVYEDYHLIEAIKDGHFNSFSVNWGITYRFELKKLTGSK